MENVSKLKKKQFTTIVVMSLFFFLLSQIIPETMVKIFLGEMDSEFLKFAVGAIRVFSLSFLVLGLNIGIGGFLTSIKKPKYEFLISILRGYILVFLSVKFAPVIFGKNIIWSSLLISELLTFIVSFYLLQKSKKII